MTTIRIPHGAIVFAGDGGKALFLRDDGDEEFPNLETERVFVDDNPRQAHTMSSKAASSRHSPKT